MNFECGKCGKCCSNILPLTEIEIKDMIAISLRIIYLQAR